MKRTLHGGIIPPTPEEMSQMAKQVGVKTYSPDFVEDLCNIMSGGRWMSDSEFAALNYPKLKIPEDAQPDEIQDMMKAHERKCKRTLNTFHHTQEFVDVMEPSKHEGKSPLEKSMRLLKQLSQYPFRHEGTGNREPLPVAIDASKDELENIKETMERFKQLDDSTQNALDGIPLDGQLIREFLKINSRVNNMTKMKSHKVSKMLPDRQGSRVRLRVMNTPSELPMATPDLLALPKNLISYKVATRQALVREKVSYEEKKQFLYLLIDRSGSMEASDRCGHALAILMNRIKAVQEGNAVLAVSWFDDEPEEPRIISTMEDASEYIDYLKSKNLHGGGTEVDHCIRETIKNMKDMMSSDLNVSVENPELCIITDGDDTVKLTYKDLEGIKLHAFLVGNTYNNNLLKLAKSSGGVAYRCESSGSDPEDIPF